ncbi:MAG: hypothetical protein VX346_27815 [Planctomycetota bacterium]|nr:hypothetical protein [Planctomycetota bacterium]
MFSLERHQSDRQWADPANWLTARVPGRGDDGVTGKLVVPPKSHLEANQVVAGNDGIIDCWDFYLNRDSIIPPRVDLRNGRGPQRRNDVVRIKSWIHSKWIIGDGGKGEVEVVFAPPEHPDCTVI